MSNERSGKACLLSRFLILIAATATDIHFSDITETAKVDFRHQASVTSNKYLIETMGAGVALFDYNNDGRLDIFFTNGAHLSDPMVEGEKPNKSDRKFWNRLYHQNPDGTFTDVTEKAGLTGLPQNRYDMGVAVGDYDNDGKLDLFVCRYLKWTFRTTATAASTNLVGGPIATRTTSQGSKTSSITTMATERSQTFLSAQALQIRKGNRWASASQIMTAMAGSISSSRTTLFAASCTTTKFSDVALAVGTGDSEDGKTFAGMGTDFSDFDNDGRPDIIVTDLSNERYMLFRNNGDGTFTDATNSSGLGRATLPYSGWSTDFLDFDNDGKIFSWRKGTLWILSSSLRQI